MPTLHLSTFKYPLGIIRVVEFEMSMRSLFESALILFEPFDLEPYAYLSPSIPTGEGDEMRLTNAIFSNDEKAPVDEVTKKGALKRNPIQIR
ncbi:hypothetical protein Y032_0366g19 [Ancylostoma ceylanicum]|uniref:Uncharacterized protein n=1 Tax=Ancylostoma ceylanicum TaxID=53326 RepID=A0A016RV06_9BILA|nr:hypothetical protein Y032_0366g19 [Ancylostoma ceylanicum]